MYKTWTKLTMNFLPLLRWRFCDIIQYYEYIPYWVEIKWHFVIFNYPHCDHLFLKHSFSWNRFFCISIWIHNGTMQHMESISRLNYLSLFVHDLVKSIAPRRVFHLERRRKSINRIFTPEKRRERWGKMDLWGNFNYFSLSFYFRLFIRIFRNFFVIKRKNSFYLTFYQDFP